MSLKRRHKAGSPQIIKYVSEEHWINLVSIWRDLNPADRLDQLFSTGGDGTGDTNQAALAAKYSVVAPAGKVIFIERLCFHMMNATIRLNNYLGLTALTNGIKIYARDSDDSLLHDFTPHAITVGGHYSMIAGTDIPTEFEAGDDTFSVRWTLAKAGHPLKLTAGQYMEIDIRDSLASMTEQHCQAQGWQEEL